jgi:hypothetical protein
MTARPTRRRRRPAPSLSPVTTSAAAGTGPSRRLIASVLAVFAAVFITLSVASHSRMSATWDEPMHLAAGYMALAEGDHRVDPSHPPFIRMWAALPLLAMDVNVDRAALSRASAPESTGDAYEFARQFVFVHNDADRLLFASRTMIVVWGVVLGILVFAWAYEWLGFIGALLALTFYTLEPNIGAHASLTTTDFGVTCFVFGAAYFLWRTCRQVTRSNVAALSIFVALAVVTKFSGLILLPLVVLLLAFAVFKRCLSLKRAAAVALIIAATTLTAVWGVYSFRYAASDRQDRLHYHDTPVAIENAPTLARVTGWLDDRRVLPNAFTQGLLYSQASSRQLPAFLAGHYSSSGGWWYYFPVAFLVKTPAALLVLLAIGLIVCLRRRHQDRFDQLFVAAPPALYAAVAMTSGINIGLRHILPIFPFVLIVAAAGADALRVMRRPTGAIALAGMTAFWGATYAAVYPFTLTFFNQFVGGPRNGSRLLTDSNLDWGQHLKALKSWMTEAGVPHVNLAYFGTADPAYYGIDCTHLPGAPTFALPRINKPRLPGYVAISATIDSGVYLDPRWRLFYRGFRRETPVATIGNALRVYWVDSWPEADRADASAEELDAHVDLADALFFGQQWVDHSITHYRIYLAARPNDAEVLARLGVALITYGDSGAAIEALLRAVALSPGTAAMHDALGVAWVLHGRPQEAARAFLRALDLDPGNASARNHLARLRGEYPFGRHN